MVNCGLYKWRPAVPRSWECSGSSPHAATTQFWPCLLSYIILSISRALYQVATSFARPILGRIPSLCDTLPLIPVTGRIRDSKWAQRLKSEGLTNHSVDHAVYFIIIEDIRSITKKTRDLRLDVIAAFFVAKVCMAHGRWEFMPACNFLSGLRCLLILRGIAYNVAVSPGVLGFRWVLVVPYIGVCI